MSRNIGTIFEYIIGVIIESVKEILLAVLLISKFEKPYQYNILTWVSYFFIALSCFLIAISVRESAQGFLMEELFYLPFIGFIFTTFYTAGVLSALSINRSRSMATRERLWRYLLDKKMFLEDGKHFLIQEREKENELNDHDKRRFENSEIIKYCKREFEKERI